MGILSVHLYYVQQIKARRLSTALSMYNKKKCYQRPSRILSLSISQSALHIYVGEIVLHIPSIYDFFIVNLCRELLH